MTVPRYGDPRVPIQPISTPYTPPGIPEDAFGVRIQRGLLEPLARDAEEIYQRHRQRADQIAVTSADAKAAALETEILYNPKTGVLNMRGQNALQARDALQDQWKKGLGEIEKDLHNDTQREAFSRASLSRFGTLNDTVARHISTELDKHENEQTQALVTNETNASVAAAVKGASFSDIADRSTLAIARQRATLVDFADHRGLSPEEKEQLLDGTRSATHAAVIQKILANGDDITAKTYFDEFKDQLKGQDLVKATKDLEVGSMRGESQRQSDAIIAKFGDDREGAIAEAKKIKDPALRDETQSRITQEYALRASLKREKENDLYLKATQLIEPQVKSGRPFIASQVVPAGIWDQLPEQARNALERRALHADSDYPNDASKWHEFLQLKPQDMGNLNQQEFETKYWSHFDRETRTRAELMWRSAADGVTSGKSDAKMAADETFKGLINISVQSVNPSYAVKKSTAWSPSEIKFYNDFTVEAMRRKEAEEQEKGKPLTRVEMQKMMDGLVHERVFIDIPMRHDPYMLPGSVSQDDKQRAYVPVGEIPEASRNELSTMIKNAHGVYSQRKIERLYAARLMNDVELFRKILQEK